MHSLTPMAADTVTKSKEGEKSGSDLKHSLFLNTLDEKTVRAEAYRGKGQMESLSHSDIVSPHRPKTTKFEHAKGKTCNFSNVNVDSQKCNFFTPFMSINLRMKYIKNSDGKKSKRSKNRKDRSLESIYSADKKSKRQHSIDRINQNVSS